DHVLAGGEGGERQLEVAVRVRAGADNVNPLVRQLLVSAGVEPGLRPELRVLRLLAQVAAARPHRAAVHAEQAAVDAGLRRGSVRSRARAPHHAVPDDADADRGPASGCSGSRALRDIIVVIVSLPGK